MRLGLRALSQALRRGVLLAQLHASAAAILSDKEQLLQMIVDFRAVDFRMVVGDALLFYGADMPHFEQQRTPCGRALVQANAHAQGFGLIHESDRVFMFLLA